jgi:large subunit ribosomal protein L10
MVSPAKLQMAEGLKRMLTSAQTIGLVDIEGYESAIVKRIRKRLLGKAQTKFIKKRVFQKVVEQLRDQYPKIDDLVHYLGSQNMVITYNGNPFDLINLLEETKIESFVKPGEPAPKDIEIPAGPTPFRPGPILTELKKMGLKVRVEKGQIVIAEPKVVVKAGEPVPENVASLLQKLGIKPKEVKLVLKAAYYQGMVIKRDILLKTKAAWIEDIKRALEQAKYLALGAKLPTDFTIRELVTLAYSNARYLALGANYVTSETLKDIVSKAVRLAEYLKTKLLPESQ